MSALWNINLNDLTPHTISRMTFMHVLLNWLWW